jgi:hypothetical protein
LKESSEITHPRGLCFLISAKRPRYMCGGGGKRRWLINSVKSTSIGQLFVTIMKNLIQLLMKKRELFRSQVWGFTFYISYFCIVVTKIPEIPWVWCPIPAIPATQKVETGELSGESQPGQHYLGSSSKTKGLGAWCK